MTVCKDCPVSAACVAVKNPRELYFVQCIYCAETFIDTTEPDGDIELHRLPGWECKIWSTSAGMRRADGGDDEWIALLKQTACPYCGRLGIRPLKFLFKIAPHLR